jgi:hypothetical protein
MKNILSASCVATLFLVSAALPGERLRFAVKEKTRLSKVFDGKIAFHSTGIHFKVDGNEIESPASGAKIHLEESSHVELQDEYGAPKDGQPTTVKRTFDKLEGKNSRRIEMPEGAPDHGPGDTNQERKSALEGKTVLFTLGEGGEYKATLADGKGEADLLEDLEEDMDLRALLSDAAVEVDKSWTIDAKAFHSVLNLPGGDLKLKSEEDKDNSNKLSKQLQENASGKAKGTYKGMREVDGKKYAVVALEAELESKGEHEDTSKNARGAGTTEVKIGYSVEGELLWDVEAGHFHACKMESKATLTMKSSGTMERGDEKHEIERTTEFEGEGEFKTTVGD